MTSVPPTGLPVEQVISRLRLALAERGVAVITAEPGAGKTTVVPLRLLGEGWLQGQRIVMLEPRRVAARAAARRMASLLGDSVGGVVGYRTRDDHRVGAGTRVEVVTEAMLTRRLQHDPSLDGVGLVIFDELHQRSIHTDLALALAIEARAALRADLRLLAMSATIDAGRVAQLIGVGGVAPVIHAPGRLHRVETIWDPPGPGEDLIDAVAGSVLRGLRAHTGDVLVFLPGAPEIRRLARVLATRVDGSTDVRPLHGALDADAQDRAIAPCPSGRRKVVVATDIAETSLTVEGITVVVDAGRSRTARYDQDRGMSRLVTTTASRASAAQRAGRAGRTAEGTCYRIWARDLEYQRAEFDAPEIATADLAGLVLEAAAWGCGVEELPMLDAPPPAAVAAARLLLGQLGLVDGSGRITAQGRRSVELPLHPRLAAMVVAGVDAGLGWLACVTASVLEERDVLGATSAGRDVDLGLRVRMVAEGGRRGGEPGDARLLSVLGRARQLARRLGRPDAERAHLPLEEIGRLVMTAFPDRVGRRRAGRGRYLLSSGAGASLDGRDPMAAEEYVVAVDVDGDRTDARIRLAAATNRNDIETTLDQSLGVSDLVEWRPGTGVVHTVRRRLGAVELSRTTRRPQADADTAAVVLGHVRRVGVGVLGWSRSARALRQRVAFARVAGDMSWPDLSDEALLVALDAWLGPHVAQVIDADELAAVDVHAALWGWLGWHRRVDLDRSVPPTVRLPSGRVAPVDYGGDRPLVRGRVQEFYGAAHGPTIVDGRYPLTLELLSPADRPLQVTSDLEGFWEGSWAEVRKEMRGRYPKHRWPEDPAGAKPGRRR